MIGSRLQHLRLVFESLQQHPVRCVPKFGASVRTRRYDAVISRATDSRDKVRMPNAGPKVMRSYVPKPGSIVCACGENSSTFRAEHSRRHTTGVGKIPEQPTGRGVP